MHFAGIDIPDELVQAQSEGEVVFFVGAGASMGPPTSLPSFAGLTREVAEVVGAPPPSDEQLEQPDVYLGTLENSPGVDVHGHVARLLRRGRRRGPMHDALARLAAGARGLRLVTTNFDNFLLTAAKHQGNDPTLHFAPALPLGDDFEGIVHLHGHLRQDPQRLILTDRDFGSAYITRGWAPQFLRSLFSKFVVCFVGYSHEDRMMDYFAKGLTSGARDRYIFTDNRDSQRWEGLGVRPIHFPEGRFDEQIAALAGWAAWASSTPYDDAERLRALRGGDPPSDPEENDFVARSLCDTRLAREVCDVASSDTWVRWMLEQPLLRSLLERPRSSDLADGARQTVADWFARHATGHEHSDALYEAASADRSEPDASLVLGILRQLLNPTVDPATRSLWLRWASAQGVSRSATCWTFLEFLWSSDVELSLADSMMLLDILVTSWGPPSKGLFGVLREGELVVDSWHLREGTRRRFNFGGDAGRPVVVWAGAYFETAHRRVAAEGGFDGWNWSRSAIEANEQDRDGMHAASSALIDLARDALAACTRSDPEVAAAARLIWLNSDAPLLQRLAINHIRTDAVLPPSEKINTVLSDGRLWDLNIHHEVYMLIAGVVEQLDEVDRDRLVRAIACGPPVASDEVRDEGGAISPLDLSDRQIYELMHWVQRHSPDAPTWTILEEIEARHPGWKPREHAEFQVYTTVGSTSVEEERPWTPEQYHQMVVRDVSGALAELMARLNGDRDHDWWGAGNMLQTMVESWPEDGLSIWHETDDTRVRAGVLLGWAQAPLEDSFLTTIASLLDGTVLEQNGSEVVRLLYPWTNDISLRSRWVARSDGRGLARDVAAHVAHVPSNVSGSDLATSAINSSVGTLTDFWIGAALDDAASGTYPGGLLSGEIRSALEELLAVHGNKRLVEATLLRHLAFLFRADQDWTREHVLRAIDPAVAVWDDAQDLWGVTLRGQLAEDVLEAGLREWIVAIAPYVGSDSELARALARVVALVATRSSMDDSSRIGWLKRITTSGGTRLSTAWMLDVGRQLDGIDSESLLAKWSQWMDEYVRQRVAGIPRALDPAEFSALVAWVALLPAGDALTAAIAALRSARCGFGVSAESPWLRFPVSAQVVERCPVGWARLLATALGRTAELGHAWIRDYPEVLEAMRNGGAETAHLVAIERELFRLGVRIVD